MTEPGCPVDLGIRLGLNVSKDRRTDGQKADIH